MGTPAFEPERVLAGRYRLERRLGKGGMGTIWCAEHLVLQAPVAVKLIDRDAVPDEETIGRFLREAKAAATLRSPHVVQILDYGMDEGVPFIVMELLEGENLSDRLRRSTRLSPAETLRIVTHIGRAIGRAHEAGIVHRDLKPENVFLVHNEDEEIAKVLDFGVAKVERGALGEGTRTRTGSILGTPYYMSPEQAQGNKTVDHRSDLWSLGVIAFECLTGKRPFYSDGLGDLVLQICVRELPVPSRFGIVPPGFDDWFARAVARDPELRFQSAREMTEALREALGFDPREPQSSAADLAPSTAASRGRAFAAHGFPSERAADATAPTVALEAEEVQRLAQSGIDDGEPSLGTASTANAVGPTSALTPRSARNASPRNEPANDEHPSSSPDFSSPKPASVARRRTLHSIPPPSGSSLGTVVAVAAAALALGMAGGLVWLWQTRGATERTSATTARPLPTAPAPRQAASSADPAHPRDRNRDRDDDRARDERDRDDQPRSTRQAEAAPSAAPDPSASASASAAAPPASSQPAEPSPKGPASAEASEPKTSPPVRTRKDGDTDPAAPDASSVPRGHTAPDGTYIKPAWAVPDEEPRRAPDLMQEERNSGN